jgi:hypothetical protein
VIGRIQWQRRRLATGGFAPSTRLSFTGLWLTVLVLLANMLPSPVQGIGLYAGAIALSLAIAMSAFVHRIALLADRNAEGDWDLRRG